MQQPGAQLSLSIVAAVERPIPMNVTDPLEPVKRDNSAGVLTSAVSLR
jgi:hypothetical protein